MAYQNIGPGKIGAQQKIAITEHGRQNVGTKGEIAASPFSEPGIIFRPGRVGGNSYSFGLDTVML
jgi:hypothetical protein